ASIFLCERVRGAQVNENSSDLSGAPDVRAARLWGPSQRASCFDLEHLPPTSEGLDAQARLQNTAAALWHVRDQHRHLAGIAFYMLPSLPTPSWKWSRRACPEAILPPAGCVGYALIASARHVLASSALIGAALFGCGVGAVSADNEDPASATAMSAPRVLINLKPDLKTLMEPIPAPRIARLRKQRAFFRILPHRKSNIASHSSKGGNYASFYIGDRAGRCIHFVPRDPRGSQNRRLQGNGPCRQQIAADRQEWHFPHWYG